jgi:thioredoxin-related protein
MTRFPGYAASALMFLWLLAGQAGAADLPVAHDLRADGAQARADRLPVVLFFHSKSCPFCRQVEDLYLSSLQRDNARNPRFILRSVDIGDTGELVGFDGRITTAHSLARQRGVRVVPHLQFVGPDGKALAPDLIGVSIPEFYGGYLEDAIRDAGAKMRPRVARIGVAPGSN